MPYKAPRPCTTPGCPNLSASGKCDDHARKHERERGTAAERGYGATWQRLRQMVLSRDPLCTTCAAEERTTPSTDADHIIPKSRGGQDTLENLQGLCHSCHSRKTAGEEGFKLRVEGQFRPSVTIVCGPPGAGKSTYVRERMMGGDLIIDMDAIYHALSWQPYYDKPAVLVGYVLAVKEMLISMLRQNSELGHAWVITGGARRSQRHLFDKSQDVEVVIVKSSPDECLRRIQADPRRKGAALLWQPLIRKWYEEFEPD
jgi:5-methylcytosine-specific restriction protein A